MSSRRCPPGTTRSRGRTHGFPNTPPCGWSRSQQAQEMLGRNRVRDRPAPSCSSWRCARRSQHACGRQVCQCLQADHMSGACTSWPAQPAEMNLRTELDDDCSRPSWVDMVDRRCARRRRHAYGSTKWALMAADVRYRGTRVHLRCCDIHLQDFDVSRSRTKGATQAPTAVAFVDVGWTEAQGGESRAGIQLGC